MRAIINENVREIMEEMMGGNAQPQQTTMPTPGGQKPPIKGGKVGQPAQQVAAGVQATANQAAQQAAAAGDKTIQDQIAKQQGLDPAHAAQVNKTAAAQPQPAKANPTALARDRRNDNLVNKQQANAGQVVQPVESTIAQANADFAELDKLVAEDDLGKQEGEDASSPDDKPDMNDDSALGRAKERAKEIHGKTGSEADFPGEKKDLKAAGYGKDGAGRKQGHHEVTHPCQRIARSTEKDGKKADEAVAETVYTDAERKTLLDGIFGA